MKKYFVVSFQKSESVYCSNIAHAESVADVEANYSKYAWFAVSDATDGDLREAERKGKPIVEIEPAPIKETEAAPDAQQDPESNTVVSDRMSATITDTQRRALKVNDRKENRFFRQYSAIVCNGSDMYEAVTARFYHTESRIYCCVWARSNWAWTGDDIVISGSGRAGGGGYDRISASAAYALEAAGVQLSEAIDGRGERVLCEALEAVARAVCAGSGFVYRVFEANA